MQSGLKHQKKIPETIWLLSVKMVAIFLWQDTHDRCRCCTTDGQFCPPGPRVPLVPNIRRLHGRTTHVWNERRRTSRNLRPRKAGCLNAVTYRLTLGPRLRRHRLRSSFCADPFGAPGPGAATEERAKTMMRLHAVAYSTRCICAISRCFLSYFVDI